MLTKKILKAVLNVKHTAIDDMKILPDGSFAIMVHPTKGEQCRCGICGRKSPYYDKGRRQRSWRTCDWNTNKVYIVADEPRVYCPEHGVVTAAVPWAMHNSRFTKEFEELATWLAMNCSKTAVASMLRISWNTIGPIISRMKNKLDPDPSKRFVGLVNIGVDETSYKKGHKYITVVINHDTGKAPEHLTEKQEAQLAFIAVSDKRLYRAYLLKEKLRFVFQCEDVETAKTELDG